MQNLFFHSRPSPWSSRCSLTLKGKTPLFLPQSRRNGNQRGGLLCLFVVRIALFNGPDGNAVSRKNNWRSIKQRHTSRGAQFLGKSRNQKGMIVPGLHKFNRKRRRILHHRRAVEPDA